jgi:hypothetical protein
VNKKASRPHNGSCLLFENVCVFVLCRYGSLLMIVSSQVGIDVTLADKDFVADAVVTDPARSHHAPDRDLADPAQERSDLIDPIFRFVNPI